MILVDTHAVVWLAFDPSRLSKKARTAIDNAREKGDGLAISDITPLKGRSTKPMFSLFVEMNRESGKDLRQVLGRPFRACHIARSLKPRPMAWAGLARPVGALKYQRQARSLTLVRSPD